MAIWEIYIHAMHGRRGFSTNPSRALTKQKRQSPSTLPLSSSNYVLIYFLNFFLAPQRPINQEPRRSMAISFGNHQLQDLLVTKDL
jgi:hypothetical protein